MYIMETVIFDYGRSARKTYYKQDKDNIHVSFNFYEKETILLGYVELDQYSYEHAKSEFIIKYIEVIPKRKGYGKLFLEYLRDYEGVSKLFGEVVDDNSKLFWESVGAIFTNKQEFEIDLSKIN